MINDYKLNEELRDELILYSKWLAKEFGYIKSEDIDYLINKYL